MEAENLDQALYDAASNGLARECDDLIKRGAKMSHHGKYKETALHKAADNGHEDVCVLLLRAFPDSVNVGSRSGLTPLYYAAFKAHTHMCKVLLEHGANIAAATTNSHLTPLHAAAMRGHVPTCALLLDNGAGLEDRDVAGRTPMLCACNYGRLSVFEFFVSRGANLSAVDTHNTTALHYAAVSGNAHICDMLLKRGATQDADDAMCHPIHYAAQSGSVETCALLLAHGADVNGLKDETPIRMAAECGHVGVCSFLLDKGASYEAGSLLVSAASRGRANVCSYLLSRLKSQITERDGAYALRIAAGRGDAAICEALLDAGVAYRGFEKGSLPVNDAIEGMHENVVDVFAKRKLLDYEDDDGRTALCNEVFAEANLYVKKGLSRAEYGVRVLLLRGATATGTVLDDRLSTGRSLVGWSNKIPAYCMLAQRLPHKFNVTEYALRRMGVRTPSCLVIAVQVMYPRLPRAQVLENVYRTLDLSEHRDNIDVRNAPLGRGVPYQRRRSVDPYIEMRRRSCGDVPDALEIMVAFLPNVALATSCGHEFTPSELQIIERAKLVRDLHSNAIKLPRYTWKHILLALYGVPEDWLHAEYWNSPSAPCRGRLAYYAV